MQKRILLLTASLAFFLVVLVTFFLFYGKTETQVGKTLAANNSIEISDNTAWNLGANSNTLISADPTSDIEIDNRTSAALDLSGMTLTASPDSNKANVIDGILGTAWVGTSTSDYWTIDLGSTQNAIVKEWAGESGVVVSYLLYSVNGTDWTSATTSSSGGGDTVCASDSWSIFNLVSARYLKVSGFGTEGVPHGLCEFEVYGGASATHLSAPTQLDAGEHTAMHWTTFSPSDTIPANTAVNYRFRTSADAATWGSWTTLTASADSINLETLLGESAAANRYLQVESTLSNTDGASTPTLDAYSASYSYAVFDHITVIPASAALQVNGSQSFSATAYDDSGDVLSATFSWSASCGSIDSSGNFTAPSSAASCTVTAEATIDGVTKQGTATVTVTSSAPVPSCSDGIQNQDETGVDCGGVCTACPVAPPTCSDGIQNGDETGVDTGGSCEPDVPCQFGWNQLDGSWFCGDPVCTTVDHIEVTPKTLDTVPNSRHLLLVKAFNGSGGEINDGIVTWEVTGGQIISSDAHSAIYETPSSLGTYTVTAKLCNHEAVSTINVKEVVAQPTYPLSIYLNTSPNNPSLYPGQSLQFSALVTNQDGGDVTAYCPVTWVMQDLNAGSIDLNGLLTSTSSQGSWDSAIKASTSCYGLTSYQLLSFTTSCQANNSCGGGGGGGGGTFDISNLWPEISKNLTASLLAFGALLVALLGLAVTSLENILPFLRPNQWFSVFLKGKERQSKSGLIYDAATGIGIPGTLVHLFRAEDNKLLASTMSNRYGYFSLILPSQIECFVKVQKPGYVIQIFNQISQQSLKYSNNYFGEKIIPSNKNSVFNKAIPMALVDPTNLYSKRVLAWERAEKILRLINLPLLMIGSIASVIVVSDNASTYNLLVLGFYAVCLINQFLKFFFFGKRTVGKIINSNSKEPVELAIVRAVSAKDQRPIRTVVSNQKGEFTMTVPSGDYQVVSLKSGLNQSSPLSISVDKNWKGFQAVAKTLYMEKNLSVEQTSITMPSNENFIRPPLCLNQTDTNQNLHSDDSRSFNETAQLIEKYREKIKNNPDLKDTGNFT